MEKRIEALNRISNLMVIEGPLNEILERVMDIVLEITQTDAGSLLLREENELVFKVAKGEKAALLKKFRIKIGEGIVGYVASTKESLVVPDASKDERFYKKIADDIKFRTYNIMASPVVINDNVLGVIEVINKIEKEPFSQEDLEILEVIAHQIGLLLENSRLKNELSNKAKVLRTLIDVGLVLNACHEIRKLLDLSMKIATKTMNAEASSLMLVDELTNELVFEIIEGEKGEKIREIRLQMGEGIAGWVAQEGKPLVVPDVSKDERFASSIDQKSGFTTRSIIAAPLKSKGKIIGVIEAINKIGGQFDNSEIEFFTLLANQVALAIENARLYSYTFGAEPIKEKPVSETCEKRLVGQILKEFNLITEENLQKALHLQKHLDKKKKIGEILVDELKVLTEDALNCALSHQLNIPYVTLTPTMVDISSLALLPLDFMKTYYVIPIMRFENELSCVMADPLNQDCIRDIEKITGCSVKASLGSKQNIIETLNSLLEKEKTSPLIKEKTQIETREGEKWLLNKLKEAIAQDVSEILLEPKKDEAIIREKIQGKFKEEKIPISIYNSIVFRAKMLGGLDILKNDVLQHGKGEWEDVLLDISTFPSLFGETILLRLIKKQASYPQALFELLEKGDIEKIRKIIKDNGLVVLTGDLKDLPYSILLDIRERKVACIEKGHRFEIEDFLQIEITENVKKEDCLDMAIASSSNVIYLEEDALILDKILKSALERLIIIKTFYPSCKDAFYHLIQQDVDRVLLTSILCGIISFQFEDQKPIMELLTFDEKQKELIKMGRIEEVFKSN